MWWLKSRIIAELIEEDANFSDIQGILEPCSRKLRVRILAEKVKRCSLLYIAVNNSRLETVKYFLDDCGADPNSTGHVMGVECPCLWNAALLDNVPIAKCLLDHGADIEASNFFQTTALFISCQLGHDEMVRFLLERGASGNNANNDGLTCLMAAVPFPKICRQLLDAGTNVNAITVYGENAVMIALDGMHTKTVAILLRAGADPMSTNNSGESAIFIASLRKVKIRSEYLLKNQSVVTASIERASEIASCEKIIKGDTILALKFWQKAFKIRNRSSNIRIHKSTNLLSTSELRPILGFFNSEVANALMFIESKLGFYNLYSLNLLKELIYKIEDVDNCVAFFKLFLSLIRLTRNNVFFKMHSHLYDIVTVFFLKHYFGFTRWCTVLKLLTAHLKDLNIRICDMNKIQMLSNTSNIYVYYHIILDIIRLSLKKYQKCIKHIFEDISTIIKMDGCIAKNTTLLHFCIEKRYPVDVLKVLLSCGANVNAKDCYGKTPIRYALASAKYCNRDVVHCFFNHGLQFDENTEDSRCFTCLLKIKLPSEQSKYINLKCLAARAAAQVGVKPNVTLPKTLQILIYSHA